MKIIQLINSAVEENAQKPVESDQLRGWFFYATILIGFTICIPVFMLGPQLSGQSDFRLLIPSVYLGGLLLTVIACFAGYIGIQTRLPTPGIIQKTFGTKGSILAIAILSFTSFGWFGVQAEVFATSFATILEMTFSITLPVKPLTLVSGLLMSTTAIIGIKALGRLSYLSVPLLLVILFLPMFQLVQNGQIENIFNFKPDVPLSIGMIISIIAGGWIVGASMTPDLSRFQKDTKNMVLGLFFNFAVAYPTLILLTAALALGFKEINFITIMILAGFAIPTIFVLFFATWTTNDKNLYESSLAVSALLPKYQRWKVTAIAGLCGTAFAMLGITGYFILWLIALGVCISPVAGIYVVDFWLNPELYRSQVQASSWRVIPFVSWVAGSFAGYLTLPTESMGAGAVTLTTIPALDALLVAALLKLLLSSIELKKN